MALNPIQLSYSNIDKFLLSISKYKPYFLKGSPSSIYTFAILLKEKKCCDISFRAIFTTGESLFPYQKKKIEEIFHCKIADSYGHMERTVAICQCPFGRYHINSDYGILEIDKDKNMPSLGIIAGNVIGTSLYNFTMPLIRYKVGDMIEMFADNKVRCECGRGLPVCNKLAGRGQDVIITPDGRMLSNIFILFDIIKGALWVQIVQQQADMLKVKLIKGDYFSSSSMEEFLKRLKEIVGTGFRVEIEYLSKNMLGTLLAQKYKPVVSI